mgnify:CR=1 FL=1
MIFDTHAHYDDEAFEEDREALLESLKDGGIGAVMNVAASLESCRTTLLLAGHYDWMYAALGVHPSGTAELDEAGLKWMEFQCSHEKVRAVGGIITGKSRSTPYRRYGSCASWTWPGK